MAEPGDIVDESLLTSGYIYHICFGVVTLIALVLFQLNKEKANPAVEALKTADFSAFQRNWLVVYCLAFYADWLQGPYVFALYKDYGFSIGDIGVLFIAGFCSSMVLGTFAGGLADKYGRRFMCRAYAIIYIISCITKLFNNYNILMFGRLTGGIATSLLFCAFESWMVSEHHSRKFPEELLSDTFSKATFLNGIVAVLAGLTANVVAASYGYVAPFVLALFPLAACFFYVSFWSENYGSQLVSVQESFRDAWKQMTRKIVYLGFAQSCFEGAMYAFVFMWTPALNEAVAEGGIFKMDSLPYGLIFATFMVCVVVGSLFFSVLLKSYTVEKIPYIIHMLAISACGLTVYGINSGGMVYFSFLLFETACGVFFPAYGTLRSIIIPEESRSGIMSFFRIPLNAFVVLILIKVNDFPASTVFSLCMASHVVATYCYSVSDSIVVPKK